MRFISKIILFFCLSGFFISTAYADVFVIKNIQVNGLQGISEQTVLSYLPVRVGQHFDADKSEKIIQTLYRTGFFSDIDVSRAGDTLVVTVVERPVISEINVTGNKGLPKDKLDEVIKKVGLIQGRVYDASVLQTLKSSMQMEYDRMGKYNATVITTVTPQPRNRVSIKVAVSEGRSAQIRSIHIIGNQAFSERKLIRQLPITTPHFWSALTSGDVYTQQKLHDSLQALSDFYMDHGYFKFKVNSVQSTLTPNHNYVYIVISVSEGPVYKFKGYAVKGDLVLEQTKLEKLINLHAGDTFSKQAIKDAGEAMVKAMGNLGYAFATVTPVPQVDDDTKQVFITFNVEPGHRVYVRRINFSGNTKTEDIILRHSVRQMEGGLVSTDDINESERQLNLLGYLQDVQVQTEPVEGATDQVDLNYQMTEAPSARATASVGYGTNGFVFGAGINQNNFMGTGKQVGVNFSQSLWERSYSFNYNNPYYTPDGIQRGFSLYASRVTPGNLNVASYTTNMYGGQLSYVVPISAKGDDLSFGLGYQVTFLSLGGAPSLQLINFANANGTHFNQTLLTTGWSRNGFNKAIFPTQGLYQTSSLQVSAPGGGNSLEYYKANYEGDFLQPLIPGFILTTRVDLGYGNGYGPTKGLPFFANYFAGGIGAGTGNNINEVRGYVPNTLGPQDSTGQPMGGNKVATASLGIIFPNPISQDKLRTTAFVDGGNVYTTQAAAFGGTGGGALRYSAGVQIDWQVPILNADLQLSVARALNARHGDQTEPFQFNMSTGF